MKQSRGREEKKLKLRRWGRGWARVGGGGGVELERGTITCAQLGDGAGKIFICLSGCSWEVITIPRILEQEEEDHVTTAHGELQGSSAAAGAELHFAVNGEPCIP